MHGLRIRRAEQGDCAALAGQLGYPTPIPDLENRMIRINGLEGHVVFVGVLAACGVTGWIHLMPRAPLIGPLIGEIGGLVVHGDHSRKGVGQALLKAVERWAARQGYTGVVVRSNITRNASHDFYRRSGYRDVKTQKVYRKDFKQ